MQEFFQMLQFLLAINSINVIVEEFNHDLSKVLENKLLGIFTNHGDIVNQINQHIYLYL